MMRLPQSKTSIGCALLQSTKSFGEAIISSCRLQKCWLVWDKVNGKSDFADCELAWTNLDKAVRKFTWMWNGMLKEEPEFRTHSTQKPRAIIFLVSHAVSRWH